MIGFFVFADNDLELTKPLKIPQFCFESAVPYRPCIPYLASDRFTNPAIWCSAFHTLLAQAEKISLYIAQID